MKRWGDNVGHWLLVLVVIATVLFLTLPLVLTVSMSFDSRTFLAPFPPPSLSLQWYERFFSNRYFLNGFRTSFILATTVSIAATALGVSGALFLSRYHSARKQALAAFFMSPLMIPAVVLGFGLLLFFAILDIRNGFVRLLGGHLIITIPYVIQTTLASLVGIKQSMAEAAMSLGANEKQTFWKVTFPLAKTGIVAGAVFAFAFSLDDVAVSMFLSDPHYYTLPVALVSMMRANFDLTIAAASVLLMGLSILFIIFLDWVVGLDRIVGQGVYRS